MSTPKNTNSAVVTVRLSSTAGQVLIECIKKLSAGNPDPVFTGTILTTIGETVAERLELKNEPTAPTKAYCQFYFGTLAYEMLIRIVELVQELEPAIPSDREYRDILLKTLRDANLPTTEERPKFPPDDGNG